MDPIDGNAKWEEVANSEIRQRRGIQLNKLRERMKKRAPQWLMGSCIVVDHTYRRMSTLSDRGKISMV